MMLHQVAPHKLVSHMGTKDHPILVETESQGEVTTLSNRYTRPRTPNSSSGPSSFSSTSSSAFNSVKPHYNPLKDAVGKGKAPMWSSSTTSQVYTTAQYDILQATSMTSVQEHGPLKRKRGAPDDSEEAQLESAKKIKKAEKKRRKKERRASRVAQLVERMPSSGPYLQGLVPVNPATWTTPQQQPPPIHLNFNTLPNHLWDHSTLSGVPGFPPGSRTHQPPHFAPLALSNGYDMDVEQPEIEYPSPHNFRPSLLPYPGDNSSNLQVDMSFGRPSHVISLGTPFSKSQPLLRPQHDSFDLIQQKPSPFASDTFSINDMIIGKQNSLDQAIAENKEALAQLGASTTPEQKSGLMKSFSERNKLIARLTGEIKAHFAALKPAPAPTNVCDLPGFQWPETEFPLYVVLTDEEDEESDSDT